MGAITRLVSVPSLAAAMLAVPRAERRLGALRSWTLSGEALPADILEQLSSALPSCRFVNLYGSTEVAADATCHVVDGSEGRSVPIGRPIGKCAGLCAGRQSGAGACRRGRRTLYRRRRVGPRLCRPCWPHGGAVHSEPFGEGGVCTGPAISVAISLKVASPMRGVATTRSRSAASGSNWVKSKQRFLAHQDVRQAVVVLREDVPGRAAAGGLVVGETDGAGGCANI